MHVFHPRPTLVPPSAWLGLPWKNATPKASFSQAEWTFRLHSAYNGPITSRSGTTVNTYSSVTAPHTSTSRYHLHTK